MQVHEYYRHEAVRQRIREFCGAPDGGEPTCVFLAGLVPQSQTTWYSAPHVPPSALDTLLARGADISRSLLDTTSFLVHLDIDYFNPDAPGDSFARPAHTFFRLEPVYRAVRAECRRLNLPLLNVMTGRGYHFTGRVPLDSTAVQRLRTLTSEGDASIGLGLVMEYVAHRVMRRAAPSSPAPVVLNGTEVGRNLAGREAVSIDLSFAGDPIDIRAVRVAFGTYQTHRMQPGLFGADVAEGVPPLATVPRGRRSLVWMLSHGRTLSQAAKLAESGPVDLPDVTAGLEGLIDEYVTSSLAAFHQAFYAVTPYAASEWPATYDRLDIRKLPSCVAAPLVHPNDLLLKPAAIQHVTRTLLADGWHPRHIAGLLLSKYARDFGWGDRWARADPARRADFDVRVFSGMVMTGLDRGVDYNCVSAQEKYLCPQGVCDHDLREDRARLLAQVAS